VKWTSILGCAVLVCAQCPFVAANAAPRVYSYIVSHHLYGPIGTYERTIDDVEDGTRAESRLDITVTLLNFVVHREISDQIEVWHGKRLMSFQSVTVVDGQHIDVHGVSLGDHFMVTSPSGTVEVPADVVASDPWSLDRTGSGVVVSINSGEIYQVQVTGGEADTVMRLGQSEQARHFHVNTALHANQWEVWFNRQGVPIKFCSLQREGPVNFTLVSPPQVGDASNQLTLVSTQIEPRAP
jgi:hypothetical protein